jgi:hypothetical protein
MSLRLGGLLRCEGQGKLWALGIRALAHPRLSFFGKVYFVPDNKSPIMSYTCDSRIRNAENQGQPGCRIWHRCKITLILPRHVVLIVLKASERFSKHAPHRVMSSWVGCDCRVRINHMKRWNEDELYEVCPEQPQVSYLLEPLDVEIGRSRFRYKVLRCDTVLTYVHSL